MAHMKRLESPTSTRVLAGFLSATLHLGLLVLVVLAGGRRDGIDDDDTPLTQVVLFASDVAHRSDGIDTTAWQPAVEATIQHEEAAPPDIEPPSQPLPDVQVPLDVVAEIPPVEIVTPVDTTVASVIEPAATFAMPEAQVSALLQRIERLAEELAKSPRAQATWNLDGSRYDAQLVLEPARDGVELDRAIAEISAADKGRQFRTRIMLKRLPYSHYTKLVDQWNPLVQLHDDEIVGRMHINSRFNLLSDSQARPMLLGKVSTASGGFTLRSPGSNRESDVFHAGIETHARRIDLSRQGRAAQRARRDANGRVHELADDTRIRFFADGSYKWRDRDSGTSQHGSDPAGQSVYFIAARGATVYVQGVVAGRFLVYSPQGIVVEGNLTYAHDPRDDPDSGDFLGLVCDGDIEVAPPRITGPGDVRIQAALFARRRFVVTDLDYPLPATLEIYGSLAAGSLTASEPRYAMKVEYDPRFEQRRPPGFPSTNRFAAEDWDGQWTEVPERSAADATQVQP
jgi:hypothetical protein